ncbi:MAG TPA: peptide-methionine (S)-S-oxide reductase MsrA [Chthonomonadaceae bacterium]|nr:peptide-methionine (S)-S-oxide reductase MsrA [Chthonomonadaceae bacterium]
MTSIARSLTWLTVCGVAAAIGLAPMAAQAGPADKQPAAKPAQETATFAAGCFWSMEAIFKQLKGVASATPGYAGGKAPHPSYEQVETGTTGYAESLNIVYDPKVITYRDLLDVLLTVRDPTSLNRQGNDEGPQYRSIIFYRNDEQKKEAKEMIAKFNAAHVWPRPIVTELQPFAQFWRAENYHIDYYKLHPDQDYCRYVIAPEIAEFRAKFKSKLK